MYLVVVTIGDVASEIRRDLEEAAGEIRWARAARVQDAGSLLASTQPSLVIVGDGATVAATGLREAATGDLDIVPIVSTGPDPDADLTLSDDPVTRVAVLRAAARMARLRRGVMGAGQAAGTPSERLSQRLEQECNRAGRFRQPISVLLLTVGELEDLSRSRGESAVEGLIQALVETLRRSLRGVDSLFRSGKGEITIILPGAEVAGARGVAQRLQNLTSSLVLKPSSADDRPALPIKVRASIGVASAMHPGKSSSADLLAGAREAAATAVRQGGNRVVVLPVDEGSTIGDRCD